jgi:hypothetical protein
MTGHVHEHCATPRTWFRRAGAVWCCPCGRLHVLAIGCCYAGCVKSWQPWTPQKQTS